MQNKLYLRKDLGCINRGGKIPSHGKGGFQVTGITLFLLTFDEKTVELQPKLGKGKPPEKVGRKATGLSKQKAAGLPGIFK